NKVDNVVVEAKENYKNSQLKEKKLREEKLNNLFDSLSRSDFDAETKSIDTNVFKKLNNGERVKIVFLGDSTTEQNYQTNGKPVHVGIIQKKVEDIYGKNVEIVNAGHSGDSIEEMLKRTETSVTKHKPDVVIINSGINDVRVGMSNEEFKK